MIINVAMQMSYDNECKIKTRFWAQGGQFLTELDGKRHHAALSFDCVDLGERSSLEEDSTCARKAKDEGIMLSYT